VNIKSLDISECFVVEENGEKQVAKISYDHENCYAIFNFEKDIISNGSLFMKFSGELVFFYFIYLER
jgi:hypothetical protein